MLQTVEAPSRKPPTVSAINHVSVPVRDLNEAVRFWTVIFSAEKVREHPHVGFAEVRVGGLILGLSTQDYHPTDPSLEFPHYGFTVDPENMKPLKERLTAFGVPTQDIWTRMQVEALMYFRDPSGNLFEFYCPQGYKDVKSIPVGKFAGGDYEFDLGTLSYTAWKDPK